MFSEAPNPDSSEKAVWIQWSDSRYVRSYRNHVKPKVNQKLKKKHKNDYHKAIQKAQKSHKLSLLATTNQYIHILHISVEIYIDEKHLIYLDLNEDYSVVYSK